MGLKGTAFLAIWHGLQEGAGAEFERYHTVEHMPERLGIPGFLRGRRYMNWDHGTHVCFTMYEASHAEVFRSPGYAARLNAPTEWTQQVQPRMTNFLRGVCEHVYTSGDGVAGAASVLRLRQAASAAPDLTLDLGIAGLRIGTLAGVCGVHLARHRAEVGSAPTRETALRPKGSGDGFDFVAVIEALDPAYLAEAAAHIEAQFRQIGLEVTGAGDYRLSYQLETPGG